MEPTIKTAIDLAPEKREKLEELSNTRDETIRSTVENAIEQEYKRLEENEE